MLKGRKKNHFNIALLMCRDNGKRGRQPINTGLRPCPEASTGSLKHGGTAKESSARWTHYWVGAVTCYMFRGSDMLQVVGRLVCTWRAPSSPHLACGLNRSFFLRTCGPLTAAQAGRLLGVLEGAEPCGTLRGWMFYATRISTHEWLKLVSGSGKRLVFF